MGIIKSTVSIGQKPTKEQLKQVKKIAKRPIHYTEDCPASTPEMLKEFAVQAVAIRQSREKKTTISLRVRPSSLKKYKSLGKGYTGIMADVLDLAANNPDILSKVSAAK
jgi:uncharacterized protein (DUF4415 family)